MGDGETDPGEQGMERAKLDGRNKNTSHGIRERCAGPLLGCG